MLADNLKGKLGYCPMILLSNMIGVLAEVEAILSIVKVRVD